MMTRRGFLENKGFKIVKDDGRIVEGVRETDKGTIEVAWDCYRLKGTARVVKPNGSVKWLYEKSDAQILRAIDQTIEANTYRR